MFLFIRIRVEAPKGLELFCSICFKNVLLNYFIFFTNKSYSEKNPKVVRCFKINVLKN